MVLVATQVKRRRGTTAENDAFTGAEGEITVDLTKKTLRVHDGSTQGGTELARMSDIGSGIDKAISNCITEIPQDIKLELNNGTLTLKAGSKVYVPNGADVFDIVTIASDINISMGTGSYTKMIFVKSDGTIDTRTTPTTCYSGSSAPTGQTNMAWYDTTNNLVKLTSDSGSTWTSGYSLPIATATITSDVITSIDQVFNGFGYIGSTVFALPGVKGLIPDGRNADGSLKNTEFITGHVSTVTNTSNLTTDLWYSINANGNIANSLTDYWKYDEQKNFWVHGDVLWTDMPIARSYANGGKVENFVSKPTFHALDYNDSEYIAHQAMPSNRYDTLTLGVSGASYTAPADGYIFLVFGNQANASCYIKTPTVKSGVYNVNFPSIYAPIQKGDVFTVEYSGGTPTGLYFVYANGAQ